MSIVAKYVRVTYRLLRPWAGIGSRVTWCLMALGAGSECSSRAAGLLASLLFAAEGNSWMPLLLGLAECGVRIFWAVQAFKDAGHTAHLLYGTIRK